MQRSFVLVLALLGLLGASLAAQVQNPSFENNAFGVPVNWSPSGVGGTVVLQFLPDAGVPTQGVRYVTLDAGTSGPATPHTNIGGVGSDASGTMKMLQSFNIADSTMTTLSFDCVLLGNDDAADFLEASISDGSSTLNIAHLDVLNDVGSGPPSFTGLPTSPLTTISVDLGAAFPMADINTVFTLIFHIGNVGDTAQPARAYIDNIVMSAGTPFGDNSIRFIPAGSWVQLEIRTEAPFLEYYTVISHNTAFPKGTGPFGGIWPDAQTWGFVTLPLGNAGIHDLSNAAGEFNANVWAGLAPAGFPFDYFLAVVLPSGDFRLTPVKRGAWNVAEDM